ncbi:type I glyceraldehyde-3-phosphate dehydrogenase, partial [Streptomyces sp. NPDC054837]
AYNIPPPPPGAAGAVGVVGRVGAGMREGCAGGGPVEDGSLTDLTLVLNRAVTADEVNSVFREAADGPLKGILRVSDAPIVSRDVVGDPASCVLDAPLTQAHGNLVKVFGWYDNEWGYSNRLLDLTEYVAARLRQS